MDSTSFVRQFKSIISILLAVYIPAMLLLACVVALSAQTGRPIWYFTRDMTAIFFAPVYAGFLSNIGLLVWSVAAAICYFSFLFLHLHRADAGVKFFFLVSGIFTNALVFDDLFLFHEELAPRLLHISQAAVFGIYGLVAILYLFRFRKVILSSTYQIMMLAFLFFALSMAMDILSDYTEYLHNNQLFEDGSKFFGIVSWLTYFCNASLQQIHLLVKDAKAQ